MLGDKTKKERERAGALIHGLRFVDLTRESRSSLRVLECPQGEALSGPLVFVFSVHLSLLVGLRPPQGLKLWHKSHRKAQGQ